jgi:hypothetical protein
MMNMLVRENPVNPVHPVYIVFFFEADMLYPLLMRNPYSYLIS